MRDWKQFFHLPVLAVHHRNAVAAAQGDVDAQALVIHGDAARIVDLRDSGNDPPLHRAEDLDGIGRRAADYHLSIRHGNLVESGVSGKVHDGNLAQPSVGGGLGTARNDQEEEEEKIIAHQGTCRQGSWMPHPAVLLPMAATSALSHWPLASSL